MPRIPAAQSLVLHGTRGQDDELLEGVEFRVLARESGWVRAELPDGAACRLPADAVGTY